MANPSDPYAVEQQLNTELAAVTDARTAALLAAWALAWSEISADLRDTLAAVLADGARITAATLARSDRLAGMLAQTADRIDEVATESGVTITADLDGVVERGVEATRRLIAPQLDPAGDDRIDLDDRPRSDALDAIVRRSSEQITSLTRPLSADTYAVVQRELIRGVAVGDNPKVTARRMVDRAEDRFNLGRDRAVTIARTETLDAYREAGRVSQARHATALVGWVWLAHLGPRTCRSCLAMHGRVFDLDVPGPHDHQQGRCARCPVVAPRGGGEPDLSWVPSADDQFDSLPEDDQRALLGVAGFAAWKRGEFPREAWTKTRTTDGWRDAQVPASPGAPGGGSATPGRVAGAAA